VAQALQRPQNWRLGPWIESEHHTWRAKPKLRILIGLVRDIMSTKPICARPDQSVEECMAVMTAKAVRHLPVLERGRLVGIVSIGDMVKSVIGDQKFIIEQLEHFIHGDR
jgi:CBS domain-containing protein